MPSRAGFGVEAGLVAGKGEAVVGDVEMEVFGHLVLPQHGPDPQPDLVRPPPAGPRCTEARIGARVFSVAVSRSFACGRVPPGQGCGRRSAVRRGSRGG